MNKALWGVLAGMGLAIAVFWSMGSVGEGAVRREQAITERVAAEQREATERMRIAAQADVQRTGHLVDAAVFLFALALSGTVVLVAVRWVGLPAGGGSVGPRVVGPGRRGGWLVEMPDGEVVVVRRALVDRGE